MITPMFKWMKLSDDGLLQQPGGKRNGGWFDVDLNPWDGFPDEEAAVKALAEFCGDECWTQDFVLIKVYRHST